MRTTSWMALCALAAAVGLQPYVGCLPEESPDPGAQAAADLVEQLGPNVVVPTLTRFRLEAATLRDALQAWADGGSRDDARPAFVAATAVWQEAELLQIGPAGSSLTSPGGEDLRDEIYSWPTVNPCRIDQVLVAGDSAAPDFFDANLVNTYGLDALEHLLYAEQVDAACADDSALGPDGVDAARAAYALVIADGVLATTDRLLDSWDPAGGDAGTALGALGPQDALNATYDGLFYLELVTKDRKLAEPLGLGGCASDCETLAEGWASDQTVPWIAANLRGFRTLFTGGDGAGFDDLLEDQGHGDLVQTLLDDTDAALALAEQGTFDVALYEAVKAITDDLKGDVATVLSLQLPSEAAGDND